MGLLSLGTPLEWEAAVPFTSHVKTQGIAQFLAIWHRVKTRRRDELIWGDEIEYLVVKLDEDKETAAVSLEAQSVLRTLSENNGKGPSVWHPEYGRFMLESTPAGPYGSRLKDLVGVEESMRARRILGESQLPQGHALFTLTAFPRLGCPDSVFPYGLLPSPENEKAASRSLFLPDDVINAHARFPTLTANIRKRRGSKVAINVPIFKDSKTPRPFREPLPPSLSADAYKESKKSLPDVEQDALEDHIYMDCMGFGMGCCCLQVTFQACSVEEARRLYDQLAVMAPIMLALTAAAPVYRGFLANVDCRWNVISASVDDRTPEERSLKPLTKSKYQIAKSRYDSISCYLSPGPMYSGGCCSVENLNDMADEMDPNTYHYFKDAYNDLNIAFDKNILDQLIAGGVDEHLAKHYAHLFIRDPLVIFKELLDQDNESSSDHFENIQSTNWQTMRFKPPPPKSNIGWRVEFRSMEIQLTDKENAAFAVFVVLLTRTILKFDLNLYIPLSKVDENMKNVQKRDAIHTQKVWFRRHILCMPEKIELFEYACKLFMEKEPSRASTLSLSSELCKASRPGETNAAPVDDSCVLMTVDQVMNGYPEVGHPGLITLVRAYISLGHMDHSEFNLLNEYLDVVTDRASGSLMTTAAWIRAFVTSHPAYNHDSVVNEKINYDLCRAVKSLDQGSVEYLRAQAN